MLLNLTRKLWSTRRPARLGLALVCLGALALLPGRASSQAFYSVRALLSREFHTAQRVSFERVRPTPAQAARIAQRLGAPLPAEEYTFYVARTGERVDGYALFDEERGQHEMISFATFFDARGRITNVEVVAFREPYGDGVRAERFRQQFVGRDATSGFRAGNDVDIVSGSTLSSRALSVGVRRATVLLAETLLANAS